MKRFLLMFCVFVLLVCMMTGCAGRKLSDAPTSEEIKKIIPAEAKLDITDYPMLNENIPDPREIIREIPEEYRSFSFIPEEWELTENFRTEKYYTSRSDSNIRLFVYDDINDTFYTVYSAFDHPEMDLLFAYSYDSDGRLTGYNNYQNGILYSTDNGGYANLTIPVEHVVYQYVYSDGTLEYCSADINPNASLNALDREIPAEDCHGYAFSYYPYDK
ncbi:MAG: hypothetical protein IKK29_05100, partial [Christensenellaceae bacterium]|nr:hypothetical protein [Christensenellaceae bacterium]